MRSLWLFFRVVAGAALVAAVFSVASGPFPETAAGALPGPLGSPTTAFESPAPGVLRARTASYTVELDPGGASVLVRRDGQALVQRLSLRGATKRTPRGGDVVAGYANYLRGADPSRWRTRVPRHATARYVDVYPDIDWVFRTAGGAVAYDFVVRPGGEPARIDLHFENAETLDIGPDGSLSVGIGGEQITHSAPLAYQRTGRGRVEIEASFEFGAGERTVGFRIGDYDRDKELVIDPAIAFSTYFGGTASEDLPRIALAPDGAVVIAGTTASTDLPARVSVESADPAAARLAGDLDVFVAKFDRSGTRLEYVTYLGGSGGDRAGGVVVADDGAVWVSGETTSPDLTDGGGLRGPADAFLARVSADGTALEAVSTFGGSGIDLGTGLARDPEGHLYLTGQTGSPDLDTVAAAQPQLGGAADAFVVKLDPSGRETLYATYLGGAQGNDAGFAVAADGAGNAYVTGSTEAPDFPVVAPVQPEFRGTGDAFVVKLSPGGSIVYATTLGGSAADAGLAIAVDAEGAAYVTGQTASPDFPTLRPVQRLSVGPPDAFVTKIDAAGEFVVYSTFLGGGGADVGAGIAVDGAGNAHVTGMTASSDFPTQNSLQPFLGGGADVFVARLDDIGSTLTYSTFSGGDGADAGIGIVVDETGSAYVVGQTGSTDFPTFNPVQPGLRGVQDAFVTKYCLSLVFPEEREVASGVSGDYFAVTTPTGCAWIASSEADWIRLTTPNVVAGPAEVQFETEPNATGAPRSGIVNIAGTPVTVVQAAATDCPYRIDPSAENFYMEGGVGRIEIETREDCAWTAVSNVDWIYISSMEAGTGAGTVSYVVEANRTGRQRSGTISVAGHTFVVFDWIR